MTREWPAEEHASFHATSRASPHNAPVIPLLVILACIALAALLAAIGSLDVLLDVIGNPLEFLVMVVIVALLVSTVADGSAGLKAKAARTLPERALRRGIQAVTRGEDPRGIARGLREVDMPDGRSRLYRDVAARFLERAGECRGLDWRLRREARKWLQAALDEIHKEMK